MINLGKRLSLIASLISDGAAICDVGTDHGYLPAYLYLSGKYTSVTATDINEKPLESAKSNLSRLGADGVKLVLCDGLEGISRADADCIIIAGMGGEVISGIISRCPFLRDKQITMLLQPMTAASFLREFMAKNGFFTESEYAIKENGKIYSVMRVKYDGEIRKLSGAELKIGKLSAESPEGREYIEKQYRIILKCAEDIKNIPEKKTDYEKHCLTANQIKTVLEEDYGI